jgi:hypothetical protein
VYGPEIESRRGRDINILSVGPYNGSDRKPKHVAVFSKNTSCPLKYPIFDLLNLKQRDALGILEICPAIVNNLYIHIFSIRIVTYVIFPAMFFS